MTTTQPAFLVLCGKFIDEYAPERDVNDMDRETTIKEIAEGQFESIARVLEIGTGADVTGEFAREVMNRWASRGEPLSRWQQNFIEQNVSVQAANSFERAA